VKLFVLRGQAGQNILGIDHKGILLYGLSPRRGCAPRDRLFRPLAV
jgi:hypothetical protein